MEFFQFIQKTFNLKLGGMDIEPTYWQAGVIIFLIFLLILTLARLRYLYVHWALGKSAVAMVFWGFILAVIFEGFLLISGRTIFTEILGWQNPPKPISTILEASRTKLVKVLGVSDEKERMNEMLSETQKVSLDDVILLIQKLDPEEAAKLRSMVCLPRQ